MSENCIKSVISSSQKYDIRKYANCLKKKGNPSHNGLNKDFDEKRFIVHRPMDSFFKHIIEYSCKGGPT
jgi:hypothetical protein